MKKSLFLLMMFLGLAFTGCEPMEDIHDEVDAVIDQNVVQGVANYTLTEEDYTDDVEDGGLGLRFPNFNSVEDARALIPVILDRNYPMWGEGSLVNAAYNLYDPLRVQNYTMTEDDYESVGASKGYITSLNQIKNLLSAEFASAEEGDYVKVTYEALAEEIQYMLKDPDFKLIEEKLSGKYSGPAENAGEFGTFDVRDWSDNYWSDDMILEAINVVLSEEFDDVEGQTFEVSYPVFYPGTEKMKVVFDGNSYVAIGSGGIPYTLKDDDFAAIATEFSEEYPSQAESAGEHENFDRTTKYDAQWTDAMIEEALNFILMNEFPAASEGSEYSVTYETYVGSFPNPEETVAMVFENGAFVVVDEVYTIEDSSVLAYTNNSWNMPFSIEEEDYEEMGQSFDNFSDEDEAIYKIGIFLGLEFSYAEEGDFAAVEYNLFSFDDYSTTVEYLNYKFNGDKWEYIPSVVERSIQFGFEDGEWAPDNTIEYTLTSGDYTFLGGEFEDIYDEAYSLSEFGNFERRPGNRNEWTDEMILEALNVLLNKKVAPNAEEGQKYQITFKIWTGSPSTLTWSLIKTDGAWVLK